MKIKLAWKGLFQSHRCCNAFLLLIVIVIGLPTRLIPESVSPFMVQYGGDALWALAVFLLYSLLLPRMPTRLLTFFAFLTTWGIEFSQLYQADWINIIRATRLGGLILGYTFLWSDLLCYTIGIIFGLALVLTRRAINRKEQNFVTQVLDRLAAWLAFDDLPRNTRPIRLASFISLALLFAPGLGFVIALMLVKDAQSRFAWFHDPLHFPWQFWGIAFLGMVATLGGAGDWLFHKIYVTVGPKEHHSHILALASGGVVFILMALASWIQRPLDLLIPILVMLIGTVVLICYDEFAFHVRRCKPFETRLHRMLVFGNGLALMCWMHWLFVSVAAS